MVFEINGDFSGNKGKTFEEVKPEIIEEKVITDEKVEEIIVEDKKVVEEKSFEINDDAVSNYLKTKYPDRQFESLDDFTTVKEKEVEKIVEKDYKYADLIDDEDEAYYDYKRETGRTRKEFDYLKEDISSKDALELSIDKLRQETGLKLTKAEAVEYLEENLAIDLSDEDAAVKNKIALNKYSKSRRDELVAEQKKYRTPLEAKIAEKQAKEANVEMVELDNGEKMPKAKYDELVENRNSYMRDVTKAVDSVASFDFKIPIDVNGEKQLLDISYEVSKEDKHSMLSDALDVDATFIKRFQTKDGFNHQELAKTLFRGDEKNFNNILNSLAEKVRAATIEEMISDNNNENFGGRIPSVSKDGYGSLTGENSPHSGFGVKMPFKAKG